MYTYAFREEEESLCRLEMRSFFGFDHHSSNIESSVDIHPSRSPFMKERIEVMYEGAHIEDINSKLADIRLEDLTYKVRYVKNGDIEKSSELKFEQRRKVEREIGLHIPGEPDLLNPDVLFGIMYVNGRWVFGKYVKSEAVWLQHQKKPHSYSTALSTRVARAVANIAVPNPINIKAIDPCCGIGTVLVEARSMGINIVGSDRNYLVLPGARENLAHFSLEAQVTRKDIRDITDRYDVAIIDMPYNLCSVLTKEDQLEMLQSARRFSNKVIVITIEAIDTILEEAGFILKDRAIAKKGHFERHVIVCK